MADIDTMTPEQAQAEIARIPLDADLVQALQDPSHAGHKAATERRRVLYAAAYPEPAVGGALSADADVDGLSPSADARPGVSSHFDRPPEPAGYRFDATAPELEHDAALEQSARQWFHDADVPQWLAHNIVTEWNRQAALRPGPEAILRQAETTEAALRRDWGDRFEAKIEKARALIGALGDESIIGLLDRSGLANSEYLIRQLVALTERRGSGV